MRFRCWRYSFSRSGSANTGLLGGFLHLLFLTLGDIAAAFQAFGDLTHTFYELAVISGTSSTGINTGLDATATVCHTGITAINCDILDNSDGRLTADGRRGSGCTRVVVGTITAL